MQYKNLSQTSFEVSALGYGTWPLSEQFRPSEQKAIQLILCALELGINFIDTADAYCIDNTEMGYCERLVGKALKQFKLASKVVVATKCGCVRPNGAWSN